MALNIKHRGLNSDDESDVYLMQLHWIFTHAFIQLMHLIDSQFLFVY